MVILLGTRYILSAVMVSIVMKVLYFIQPLLIIFQYYFKNSERFI